MNEAAEKVTKADDEIFNLRSSLRDESEHLL